MNRKVLKIGIMPKLKFQAYTIAIAKGEYKPKPDEPKIWFASTKTLAQVLSDENKILLEIINKTQPNSSLQKKKQGTTRIAYKKGFKKTLINQCFIKS